MQDKEQGMPKYKRSRCKLDDEEVMLYLDERRRKVTIKHDPKILVPVSNVNPGIRKHQAFTKAFYSVIHDEGRYLEEDLLGINYQLDTNEGASLRSIDSDTYLRKHIDAAEKIQKNLDFEDKLTQVREEDKLI